MYLAWVQNANDCWVGKTKVLPERDKDDRSSSDQTEADYSSICTGHSDDNLSPPYVEPYANALFLFRPKTRTSIWYVCVDFYTCIPITCNPL